MDGFSLAKDVALVVGNILRDVATAGLWWQASSDTVLAVGDICLVIATIALWWQASKQAKATRFAAEATEKQAKLAHDALEATTNAANAGTEQVRVSARAFQASVAPTLVPLREENGELPHTAPIEWADNRINGTLVNVGAGPAVIKSWSGGYERDPEPLRGYSGNVVVPVGQTAHGILDITSFLETHDGWGPLYGTPFWMRVEYSDVVGAATYETALRYSRDEYEGVSLLLTVGEVGQEPLVRSDLVTDRPPIPRPDTW